MRNDWVYAMMSSFISGFALSFGLILAIGAQNAFVLRQGLLRQHVLPICLICGASDAILIVAGVAGFGTLATQFPWMEPVFRYGGAVFLICYGAISLRKAFFDVHALRAGGKAETGLTAAILTLLAFTWLNPHVYLDTVVLIGSVSSQYDDRVLFGTGAVAASFTFFFALGYGARIFAPVFTRPRAWQIFEIAVGLTMWAIAANLVIM